MKIHPVAEFFPMLPEPELAEMVNSIKRQGLINPCVRKDDVLLDGRNRLAACKRAGVEPRFIEYTGDSPVAFIIAANLYRRHLEKGQKIALALEIEPHFAEENERNRRAKIGASRRGETVENVPPSQKPVFTCLECGEVFDAPVWHCKKCDHHWQMYSKECRNCHDTKAPQKPSTHRVSLAPTKSRDQAAAAVGISGKLVSDAKAIREADPERFEKVKQGRLSVAKAKKEIKAEQAKRDLSAAQAQIDASRRSKIESVCDLRVCSCGELFKSGIKPDAVITDPPYPQEFLPAFTELAKGCKNADVPLVAVMCGQSYLPEVMRRLCEHLLYRWTLAYMTPGASCRIWPVKIDCQWKPVLLFGKPNAVIFDVFRSDAEDKRFHNWGQSESGTASLIERLTKPGQLICDPFLGGGTTAVMALKLGRKFIGCDIAPDAIENTRKRVIV